MGAFITRNYNACILPSWREHAKRRRSENTPFRGVVWARNEGNYMHAIRKQKGHYTSTGRGGIQFTNPFPFNFYETQRRPWRIVCTGAWQVKNKKSFFTGLELFSRSYGGVFHLREVYFRKPNCYTSVSFNRAYCKLFFAVSDSPLSNLPNAVANIKKILCEFLGYRTVERWIILFAREMEKTKLGYSSLWSTLSRREFSICRMEGFNEFSMCTKFKLNIMIPSN